MATGTGVRALARPGRAALLYSSGDRKTYAETVSRAVPVGGFVVLGVYSFDYGWYPPEDEMFETDLPFVSLWYAIGGEYAEGNGGWEMTVGDPPRSVLIASEPLTTDYSTWLEVPEYSMLTAELTSKGLEFETRDLDV